MTFISLGAIDGGVLLAVTSSVSGSREQPTFYTVWSAADGSEQWRNSISERSPGIVSDGTFFFIDLSEEEDPLLACCRLGAYSLADGHLVWDFFVGRAITSRWIAETNQVRLIGTVEGEEDVMMLDVASRQTEQTSDNTLASACLIPVWPVSESGVVLCSRDDGAIEIYIPPESQ